VVVKELIRMTLSRLPKTIKTISLSKNRKITGAGLASLAGNKVLVQLHLGQIEKLSAKGVAGVRRLEALEDLRIENEEKFWTRAHIMALRGLPKIKSIRLSGIPESDENLYLDMVDSFADVRPAVRRRVFWRRQRVGPSLCA